MSHRPSRSGPCYRHRRRTAPVEVRYLYPVPREREPAYCHEPFLPGLVRVMAASLAIGFALVWVLSLGGAR